MLEIHSNNLREHFEQLNQFGALDGGGITRLAFSPEEKLAREYVKSILIDMGMTLQEDGIGNLFAILPGENPDLPAVISGSHLDSVPNGGYFDGTLGVVAAIEAIKAIQQSDERFNRSLGVAVFSCEESSRFHMATLGSKLLNGKLAFAQLHDIKDDTGLSVYDAAKAFGCSLDESTLPMNKNAFYGFIEMHIEQGPVLEQNETSVGAVLAIASPIRYRLSLTGSNDHSGATPMSMRHDALACASEIILSIEKTAQQQKSTVATVGSIKVTPGVLNVIPGKAELLIDIRDIDKQALIDTDHTIEQNIKNITQKRQIDYELKLLSKDYPTPMDERVIEIIEASGKKVGVKVLRLPSGAEHDAMNLADIVPHTGMIFIPCKDGISHNIKEQIDFKDAQKATAVLAHTLLTLANEGA